MELIGDKSLTRFHLLEDGRMITMSTAHIFWHDIANVQHKQQKNKKTKNRGKERQSRREGVSLMFARCLGDVTFCLFSCLLTEEFYASFAVNSARVRKQLRRLA